MLVPKKVKTMRSLNIFLLLLLVSLTACKEDYLDLDPIDRYVYYNFPQNQSQVEQAVVACYRKAYAVVNGQHWVWGDYLSDNTSFRYNTSDRGGVTLEQVDEFVATADNGNFNGMYQEAFEGVTRSNYVLDNLPNVSFSSETDKGIREAEARFFRAWHYFNLVRLYGDLPIITKVITQPSESLKLQRSPAQEVYSQVIIPDAEFAVSKLPITLAAAQKGRLTKGAAEMLLAKIYMTLRQFDKATPLLQDLLTQGYGLNAKYADNFDPTKKNGRESIYEIQADPVQGISFGFMGQWTPWGTGTTVWPGGSNSRGGLNQPTDDLNKAYEVSDSIRKRITIGSVVSSGATVLYLKKFLYWDAVNRANPVNFPVYRYADALLMLAECLNEAGFPNAQAFTYLNQVRARVSLPAKTQGNANAALAINSQEDFRLAIEKERQLELAGEGHRWFDLVRTGRAKAVLQAHGTREKALKKTLDPNAYGNIRILLPVPFREINQFGFPQNPEWQ
jgi:starch-binding outer membrane protein, SusD/RagB family